MEYWKEILGVGAVIISLLVNFPYIRDIFAGKTRPHFFTWLIWSITTAVIFFGQLVSGGGAGAWTNGVTGAFTILIALLALKYGTKDITKSDVFFLILALCAIVLWVYTSDPLISVVLSAAIGVVGYFPTIRKTLNDPSSETFSMYSLSVVRHALSIAALGAYSATTLAYPILAGLMNVVMVFVIWQPWKRSKTL